MTDFEPINFEQLQRAFDRLPDLHAAIFSASRHDKLTYAEIAERTGLTRDHVMHIFADALFRLHWDLSEQQRGITIGPIRRLVRRLVRRCKLDIRLFVRVWLNRW